LTGALGSVGSAIGGTTTAGSPASGAGSLLGGALPLAGKLP
jgi:hypothetical protein